jgi:hypothetical protein
LKNVLAASLLVVATSAHAEDRAELIGECISAFAAGDTTRYEVVVALVKSWGEVADANIKRAAATCLELGANDEASTDQAVPATISQPTLAMSQPAATPDRAAELIAIAAESHDGAAKAVAMIVSDGMFKTTDEEKAATLEAAILTYAKPLPADESQANRDAYFALSLIRPENATYAAKAKSYAEAIEAELKAAKAKQEVIAKKLKKQTSEFDGSSWYRHPDSPRYQDTRPYLTLYVLETGAGMRSLEFFLNYTADSWLFVQSAQLNVDGVFISLPSSSWSRDNDTDIWEWTGYPATPQLIEIAEKIAKSKRAVVRFNGQEFYDDYVIPQSDKTVIKEMLLAWEVMKK